MTTVTAAVAREHHAPLTLEQLELDEIRDDEVRVRMVATGICHTDAVVRDGAPRRRCPQFSATREPVSSSRSARPSPPSGRATMWCSPPPTAARAGSVAPGAWPTARTCSPRTSAGGAPMGPPRSSAADGTPDLVALLRAVVLLHLRQRRREQPRAASIRPCRRRFSRHSGAGSTPVPGAVLNELRPPAGSSFAVTGAGAVGLAAIMAARVAGCTTIVAVDLHDSRLELAREIGATHTDQLHGPTDMADEAVGHHRRRGRQLHPRHHRRACCGQQRQPVRSRSVERWRSWEQRPPGRQPPSTSVSPLL